MKRVPLSSHQFLQGFKAGLPVLTQQLEDSYAEGSRNLIVGGGGPDAGSFVVPWQGLAGQGDNTGSRLMRQILQTYGGLQDYFVGILRVEGRGSFFSDIGKSLWFIGGGRPNIEGIRVAEGVFASTELQVAIAVNGIYSASTTYDAGMPQPSTPDIGIISTPGFGFTGLIEGPISCKVSRLRLTTGARSVASKTSAVVNPQKKTVRVTFPLPSQGQDFWAVFFTQSGFGGVGLHYRVAYQDSLDISEATVAAGIIDGIPRSLEFDFKDGDLVPEEAYIDDYPPPAGTHAVRLANVMCVLGAYGDSTAPVTSTDPGTVGAISLPNFYESYRPRNLVYFPEQIVDVLARPTDEYAYVGHRNCITALQALGGVMDGPAVAVSMVWPDIGIAKPHNWCQVHGLLYAFQAKGGPVRMMPDGSPDYSFAAPVRRYMRDWTVEDTIVGSHPDSLSVVYFNGREALSWSLQANKWSPPCFFEDVCVEDSPIPSSSPSASISPSASFSASISASPSRSPSASPSGSPSSSASASPSPSASPSASPSSSASGSPSASPSGSASASPSSSISASPSSSPSNSGSSSPSPSASPSSSSSSSSSASPSATDEPPVAGATYWLDPDQETGYVDEDPVNPIMDWSGNNNDISQATSGQRAKWDTNQSNGRPAYKFDGIDDFADLPVTVSDSAWTLYVVLRPQNTNNTGKRTILGPGLTAGRQLRLKEANNQLEFVSSATSIQGESNSGLSFSVFSLLTIARDTSAVTIKINGTLDNTLGAFGALNPIARFAYANTGGPTEPYEGWIAELILYPTKHNSTDISSTESWLLARHNLP